MPRVIFSVTSWIRRIQSCTDTIKTMLDQTVPVEVELNLDKQNFPGMMKDVRTMNPELVSLAENNPNLSIRFDMDYDIGCWQKIWPTIMRHKPERLTVLTADDDISYKPNYVERCLEELDGNDWLCSSHDQLTQGQCMVYGWRAVEALRLEADMDLVKNCPLDDYPIFHILRKYNLRRGRPAFPGSWDQWDRHIPFSFRRNFYKDAKPEEIFFGQYPQEEFLKEYAYLKSRGIIR